MNEKKRKKKPMNKIILRQLLLVWVKQKITRNPLCAASL